MPREDAAEVAAALSLFGASDARTNWCPVCHRPMAPAERVRDAAGMRLVHRACREQQEEEA